MNGTSCLSAIAKEPASVKEQVQQFKADKVRQYHQFWKQYDRQVEAALEALQRFLHHSQMTLLTEEDAHRLHTLTQQFHKAEVARSRWTTAHLNFSILDAFARGVIIVHTDVFACHDEMMDEFVESTSMTLHSGSITVSLPCVGRLSAQGQPVQELTMDAEACKTLLEQTVKQELEAETPIEDVQICAWESCWEDIVHFLKTHPGTGWEEGLLMTCPFTVWYIHA
jgi:hypothetical protein